MKERALGRGVGYWNQQTAGAGDVARLAECLPSTHKVPAPCKPGMMDSKASAQEAEGEGSEVQDRPW